jgi:hypothetical protein
VVVWALRLLVAASALPLTFFTTELVSALTVLAALVRIVAVFLAPVRVLLLVLLTASTSASSQPGSILRGNSPTQASPLAGHIGGKQAISRSAQHMGQSDSTCRT